MTRLILKRDGAVESLYAIRSYRPGEVVLTFDQVTWLPVRDPETIETPFGQHLHHPVLAKAAHSCEPSCRIAFPDRRMVAVRPIAPGEAITLDFRATERCLSRPFDCRCGSRRCRGRIE